MITCPLYVVLRLASTSSSFSRTKRGTAAIARTVVTPDRVSLQLLNQFASFPFRGASKMECMKPHKHVNLVGPEVRIDGGECDAANTLEVPGGRPVTVLHVQVDGRQGD